MAFITNLVSPLRTTFLAQAPICPIRLTVGSRAPSTIRMASSSTPGSGTVDNPRQLTEDEWRKRLTPEEYYVLRQKGTERPGTGEYDGVYPKGEAYFACRACGNPLYTARSKFASGCGWPAFDKCFKGAIETQVDRSFGMKRVEILCQNCGGHLGHVFEGERMTPTNQRHCVNSLSIRYVEGKVDKEEDKLGDDQL